MEWKNLNDANQIDQIIHESEHHPVVIFKHSTTCPVSGGAKKRLESTPAPENVDFYYLDLWTYRTVSDEVANKMNVVHKSPQVLLIKNGKCVYNESHQRVNMDAIIEQL